MRYRTNLYTAIITFVAAIAAFTVTAGAQSNEKSPRKDLTKVVKKVKKETTGARPYANLQDYRPPQPKVPTGPRKKPIIPIKQTFTTANCVDITKTELIVSKTQEGFPAEGGSGGVRKKMKK